MLRVCHDSRLPHWGPPLGRCHFSRSDQQADRHLPLLPREQGQSGCRMQGHCLIPRLRVLPHSQIGMGLSYCLIKLLASFPGSLYAKIKTDTDSFPHYCFLRMRLFSLQSPNLRCVVASVRSDSIPSLSPHTGHITPCVNVLGIPE